MHHILAKLTKKTLVAAAGSLAMVGTAGAALGTSYSAFETTETTMVEMGSVSEAVALRGRRARSV